MAVESRLSKGMLFPDQHRFRGAGIWVVSPGAPSSVHGNNRNPFGNAGYRHRSGGHAACDANGYLLRAQDHAECGKHDFFKTSQPGTGPGGVSSEWRLRDETSFPGGDVHGYSHEAFHGQAQIHFPLPDVNRFQIPIANLAHIQPVGAFLAGIVGLRVRRFAEGTSDPAINPLSVTSRTQQSSWA